MEHIINKVNKNDTGFSRHYITLYAMVVGMEAKNVFEFGAGYSSYTILKALKQTGGKLTSCDIRDKKDIGIDISDKQWNFLRKNSLDISFSKFDEPFDLVLHDGSHVQQEVDQDIKNILPYMKKDSLLLVHDTEHKSINLKTNIDVKHEKVTLPYGYGLTIVRILEGRGSIDLKWKKR